MPKGIPYDSQTKKLVVDFYKENHSLTECESHFGICRPCIASFVRQAGATRPLAERMALRFAKKGIGYRWNGGRSLGYKPGYMAVYTGRKNGVSVYRTEHLLIVEKVLGRPLKNGEVVHHINGDGIDNRNCNLLVCDRKYHSQLHQTMAKLYQQEHFK